jgi:hypothetical protein
VTSVLVKSTNRVIYDYYQESWRISSTVKPYIGLARYTGGKAVDDGGDRLLRLVQKERELSGSQSRLSAYDSIVACLWDEIIPTGNRTPTHWVDCGYVQKDKIETILCLPVRLMIPGLSPQSAATRIAGYLQAVAEQIPVPTWTTKQPISLKFCERYTGLMLKGLIAGWAHERGYMDKLRDTLSI